jgi:hypothetical protein
LKEGLTEDERYAVADHVVEQLNGDPWGLNQEAQSGGGAPFAQSCDGRRV